jgi:5'-methylthioadenosine phosphorylase
VSAADIGVVGGSGLYALASQEKFEEIVLETPWGSPSGPYRIGVVGGRKVAFLARHGAGHRYLPAEVPYRANIWGFRQLGVTRLISASACGSLREEMAPRHFVVVDQFIDRTWGRESTFFGDGLVGHVSFAEPTCSAMGPLAAEAARKAGATVHEGGTYVCIQGPQFSTRAESLLHRSWGAHVVGMTNVTEARLSREAGMCYCVVAMVTDYDCWKVDEEGVSVEALLGILKENAQRANDTIGHLIAQLPAKRACACAGALDCALITDPRHVPPATQAQLKLILGERLRES